MPVDFSRIVVGQEYERPQLALLWGYKTFHAFGRGVFTPRDQNVVVLFISEQHQAALPQYDNHFNGDLLWMDGEDGHGSDQRLINSPQRDEVHLFHREKGHSPFRYCGKVTLVQSFINAGKVPSRFVFTTAPQLIAGAEAVISTTLEDVDFVPDLEGKSRLRLHVVYERSKKNRTRALEIHGHVCVACGFDFDAVYGVDLSAAYVEVHHCRSITEIQGQVVDPATELMPLCANCHRMAHRRRGAIVPLDELRERVGRFPAWPFRGPDGNGDLAPANE